MAFFAVDSFGLAPSTCELTGPRRYGLLIASRFPVGAVAGVRFTVPWPERILAATIAVPGCQLELYTTHIPPGSTNYWIKVEMLEGLYAALASTPRGPRILCGDFNSTLANQAANGMPWIKRSRVSGGNCMISASGAEFTKYRARQRC
jgi:endonuclease/exonuclease/phosphatase family metal-dependent hydrolase